MKCTEPLEIERRFLIRRPSEEELRRRCGSARIRDCWRGCGSTPMYRER